MSPIIPHLIKEAYTAGSWQIAGPWHTAVKLELIKSIVECDGVDFAWKSVGSSIYSVTAKGSLVITEWNAFSGDPKFDRNKFTVVCSCPDGVHQNKRNAMPTDMFVPIDALYVCEHAKAALDSVCDPKATKCIREEKKAKIQELKALQAERSKHLRDQRVQQDKRFPGERERIMHGLSKRNVVEIAKLVKEGAATVEGLEALIKLFPASIMPPKKSIRCGRCKNEYDPQVKSELICREEHPDDRVNRCRDTLKNS